MLAITIGLFNGLYPENKVKNMEHPNTAKDDSPHRNSVHHNKTDRHQNRYRNHNSDFCIPSHALSFYIAFQIVPVKLCAGKPSMELFWTSGKAKRRQEQKRKGRKKRQYGAYGSQNQADTA